MTETEQDQLNPLRRGEREAVGDDAVSGPLSIP